MIPEISKEAARSKYDKLIAIPEHLASNLLSFEVPAFCMGDSHGTVSKIYDLGCRTAIVTGQSQFGNVHPDLNLVVLYDRAAWFCRGD